jgi:hypothetical protein
LRALREQGETPESLRCPAKREGKTRLGFKAARPECAPCLALVQEFVLRARWRKPGKIRVGILQKVLVSLFRFRQCL